ncbi:MAG: GNAT family N-acetyltransferase, partial [Emcibacteraceae bacterium]|nr:GNAT family N-acetyltransferase [Emcibacteraceae bacterium]
LLLEWIIKDLQGNSFEKIFLEVRENNVAAIRLYKKNSFDIIGRRIGYYQINKHQKIDALVMQCDLRQ